MPTGLTAVEATGTIHDGGDSSDLPRPYYTITGFFFRTVLTERPRFYRSLSATSPTLDPIPSRASGSISPPTAAGPGGCWSRRCRQHRILVVDLRHFILTGTCRRAPTSATGRGRLAATASRARRPSPWRPSTARVSFASSRSRARRRVTPTGSARRSYSGCIWAGPCSSTTRACRYSLAAVPATRSAGSRSRVRFPAGIGPCPRVRGSQVDLSYTVRADDLDADGVAIVETSLWAGEAQSDPRSIRGFQNRG